ncbi:hypothetical protein KZ287_34030, partial [Escherichia coli]|nr:hypothetical protein [Escherichia coli]
DVRHNTDGQSIETQQLEKGATFTNYEPYEEYSDTIRIKKQNVKGKLIDKDNLTFQAAELTLGKNLFNKSTATDGKY